MAVTRAEARNVSGGGDTDDPRGATLAMETTMIAPKIPEHLNPELLRRAEA